MALIDCPECGHKVSDLAKACPQCGYSIAPNVGSHQASRITSIISEHPVALIICICLVISAVIWANAHSMQLEQQQSRNNYTSYTSRSTEKTDASSIFGNLSMRNFSASLGKHGGKMSCEVTNNNSFTVNGYFYVGFYDKYGNLMYTQLMPLSSVASGETVICSTSIPKDSYPTGYATVKYSQASLVKD